MRTCPKCGMKFDETETPKGAPMTAPPTEPDFNVAGSSLYEWLHQDPNEATTKAAEQALAVPDTPFLVATFAEPVFAQVKRFADTERKRVAVWFHRTHPEATGRMRVHQRQVAHPDTGETIKAVLVTYQSKPKAAKK
jgi:hypothetical protein